MSENKVKVYPDIFRNIVSPPERTPLLEFYSDYYDCIYIILHPFYKITRPDKIDFERVWPANQGWPTKKEITSFTLKVSWAEFIKLSGIQDTVSLDIALRNSISGLNKQHLNQYNLKLLQDTCDKYNIIQPQEGYFSELLVDEMLKVLLHMGYQWVFTGDEFGYQRELIFIEDIIDNKVQADYHKRNWYTPKNEILYTTHWDSHFTILCSNKKTVEEILKIYPFEGFYCDENTQVYWSLNNKKSAK